MGTSLTAVQPILAAAANRSRIGATLLFNFMHYAVRPWPWIVVGVASLFLVPDVTAYGDQPLQWAPIP